MCLNIASFFGRISTHVTWTKKIQFQLNFFVQPTCILTSLHFMEGYPHMSHEPERFNFMAILGPIEFTVQITCVLTSLHFFLEGCYTRHMNQKDSISTEFLCPVYMYLNIASLFGRISTHVTWTRKPVEFFCPNLMHWHITSLWNDITHITWTRKITFCIIL